MDINGLDNVACDLTVAGYTSEEKNQILQAYKDYLGDAPPATGIGDINANNPELDDVNALNVVISSNYIPEIIDLIPFVLGWSSFDNLPDIAAFLKDYPAPITQDVKNMLGLAANVLDKSALNEILDLAKNDEADEAIPAASMTFAALNNSSLYGPYDIAHHTKINPYTDADITDPTLLAIWAKYFSANCAILRHDNPDWSDSKIYWNASKEMIHIGLDLAGLIPVIGEVFDVTNGIIYTIEGDGLNAALSYAAVIPVIGWYASGGRLAKKTLILANGSKTTLKWIVEAGDVIHFGKRTQLRKVLGLVKGDGKHAHHIIPWAHRELDIVQKAAKSKNAFHPNELLNGIALPTSNHLTGHNIYNAVLNDKLEFLGTIAGNNDDAYELLNGLINHIDDLIKNNPNMNLGQISELVNYP